MVRIIIRLTRTFMVLALLVLRWGILIILSAIPWVLRVLWLSLRLVGLSVLSLFVGIPTTAQRISNLWVQRAITAGFPIDQEDTLQRVYTTLAFLALLAGWLIVGVLLVFAWRLML